MSIIRPANLRPVVDTRGAPICAATARPFARACWMGDDGALRSGHSCDVVQMLDDLGIPSRAF